MAKKAVLKIGTKTIKQMAINGGIIYATTTATTSAKSTKINNKLIWEKEAEIIIPQFDLLSREFINSTSVTTEDIFNSTKAIYPLVLNGTTNSTPAAEIFRADSNNSFTIKSEANQTPVRFAGICFSSTQFTAGKKYRFSWNESVSYNVKISTEYGNIDTTTGTRGTGTSCEIDTTGAQYIHLRFGCAGGGAEVSISGLNCEVIS